MGGEVSELVYAKSGPTIILFAGLQGIGKTTVSAKLALYLKKQGKSCMLIAGDMYRPAVIDQLVILDEQGMLVLTLTAAISKLHPHECGNYEPESCVGPTPGQMTFLLSGFILLVIGASSIRPCNLVFGVPTLYQ
ncbi:hypothetical protein FXO38_24723 [Capsicum annuum]|nr:hypothetical protein FXO38_24723 [Capsicum annuum]